MSSYVLRRLLLMIPTILGITIVTFGIIRLAPGDPAAMRVGSSLQGTIGEEQLAREPLSLPTLVIKRRPESLFDYRFEDFELIEYRSHAHIRAPVAI